jgi:hypothetical protein
MYSLQQNCIVGSVEDGDEARAAVLAPGVVVEI